MLKYTYTCSCRIHTDAINLSDAVINDARRKTSLTKHIPLNLLQGFERVVQGLCVRGSWRPNITEIFWPQTYSRDVVSFLFFDAQPEVQRPLCWVMAFFTAPYQQLLWTPIHQGPKAPSAWCGFPYHISSISVSNSTGNSSRTQTQLSYIMVQRPLDLWNRMFDRHQAEITVMQFPGHSFPVHQSMSVPWKFFSSSHFISQFPPTFPLLTAIEWHFGPGQKVKI